MSAVLAATGQRLRDHPAIGAEGLRRLGQGGPVGLAGAGAVGARLARALAPAGVPLWIVDRGRVEPPNVGTQLYGLDDVGAPKVEALRRHLAGLRPGSAIKTRWGDIRRVGARALGRCRVLVGCLDSLRDRAWLAQMAAWLEVPYLDLALDGTGQTLYGRAAGFLPSERTACPCCGWDEAIWAEVASETAGPACGAMTGAESEPPATLALPGLAEIIAGLGGVQVLRLLLGEDRHRVLDREWRINLSSGRLSESALSRSARCRLDHRPWRQVFVDRAPSALTVGELFDLAARLLGGEAALEVPGEALVVAAGCPACRRPRATSHLRSALPACPDCGRRLVPLAEAIHDRLRPDEVRHVLDRSWKELGLVSGGVVVAEGSGVRSAFVFEEEGEPTR
jgi:molybdopterin/thiamine biosynthesis adenylyltransferase